MQNEAQSALPKIITTGFKAIRLIYFFTAGEDEVKCWQIRRGAKAPQVIASGDHVSRARKIQEFRARHAFMSINKVEG